MRRKECKKTVRFRNVVKNFVYSLSKTCFIEINQEGIYLFLCHMKTDDFWCIFSGILEMEKHEHIFTMMNVVKVPSTFHQSGMINMTFISTGSFWIELQLYLYY